MFDFQVCVESCPDKYFYYYELIYDSSLESIMLCKDSVGSTPLTSVIGSTTNPVSSLICLYMYMHLICISCFLWLPHLHIVFLYFTSFAYLFLVFDFICIFIACILPHLHICFLYFTSILHLFLVFYLICILISCIFTHLRIWSLYFTPFAYLIIVFYLICIFVSCTLGYLEWHNYFSSHNYDIC